MVANPHLRREYGTFGQFVAIPTPQIHRLPPTPPACGDADLQKHDTLQVMYEWWGVNQNDPKSLPPVASSVPVEMAYSILQLGNPLTRI